MVEPFVRVAALVEDRRPRGALDAVRDDPERLAARVVVDRPDLHGGSSQRAAEGCRTLLEERLHALREVLRLRRGLLELRLELRAALERRRGRVLEQLLGHRHGSRRQRALPGCDLPHPGRERVGRDLPP